MIMYQTTCVIMFKFSTDDNQFRSRLLHAIFGGQCPDFECSLGDPSGTGCDYTAMWRPEHADAVRTWARSVGIQPHAVKEDDRPCVLPDPLPPVPPEGKS